jgi:small subunit ribosomal protein S21
VNNNNENYYNPDEYNGICVVRRKGENDEDFVKRFRKKYAKSGLAKELRDKMYFEKPSDKRRRKKSQSIRLLKKEEEKLEKMAEMAEKYKKKQRKLKAKKQRRAERNDTSD